MNSALAASSGSWAHSEILDRMKRKREFVFAAARLSRLPVERSSMTTTDLPSFNSRSTRCPPMKPAPPVTSVKEDGGSKMEDGMGVRSFLSVDQGWGGFVPSAFEKRR